MAYFLDKPYEEVVHRIVNYQENEEIRAMLALTFLAGARVGEVVRHRHDLEGTPHRKRKNPPISTRDIWTYESSRGKTFLVIKIQVEKSKEKRWRTAYIHTKGLNPNPGEVALAKIVWHWRARCISLEERYLFDIPVRRCQIWFKKIFPEIPHRGNIHHLRHWRATAYLRGEITRKPVDYPVVAKILGHTRLFSTHIYDHVSVQQWADNL